MATQEDFARIGNYARMYNKDQNIDRRGLSRTVPLQVLALGYSRTGTLSMQKAFEILGYSNPYHFSSFYDNVRDCDIWLDLIARKFDGKGPPVTKADFDGLLGRCGAITDMPCHLFAAELIEFYPDAKIVLVERDLESWFKSWSAFLDNSFNPVFPLLGKLDPEFLGRIASVGIAGVDKQVGSGKTATVAKARSKEEYRKHYALVRSLATEERLLNFSLADGWEPLCKFLEKPVPDVPFPHVNDSKANGQGFKELAIIGLKNAAWNAAKSLAIVAVPVIAWTWRQ